MCCRGQGCVAAVLQAHQDRNEARMLTPAERKEKKMTKLVGEAAPDTLVAVFKARRPHHGATAGAYI